MMDIYGYLNNNSYPGRGIIVGKKEGRIMVAYFIMGRSENSRNRIFKKEGDALFTQAYDESKVKDPSLIIYDCVRTYEGKTIVSNGDQTDTIYDFLKEGKTFEEALKTRTYEPDEPSFTPRISAIINEDGSYVISILRRINGECQRDFYPFQGKDGIGHFISTYDSDGDPLPSFSGGPKEIELEYDLKEFAQRLWESLDENNKISLYVRYLDEDAYEDIIMNKNGG